MYICTSKRCHCGKPIEFRIVDGRVTPIHIKTP
jgi:hypothetical protein